VPRITLVAVVVCAIAPLCPCRTPQNSRLIAITSPANGSIVHPGQVLAVSVTSPTDVPFTHVAVLGEQIGFSDLQTAVPATLSLTIPKNIACRSYTLTALGVTTSGQRAESDPILIDVEPTDTPVSISTTTSGIAFGVPGETSPIQLLATFSDGSVLDVTESSNVAYSSSNTRVAMVEGSVITAVSPGRASVRAIYRNAGRSVEVQIPITVPVPVLAPSVFSISFADQNVGASSAAQRVVLTNNSNGPLRIISISPSGDFAELDNCISSSPLPIRGTCTVNITFRPLTAGLRLGELRIAEAFDNIPMSVRLAGTGLPPTR